ncbi:MAG TPA: hypothetical protein VFQ73_10390 [Flavisolibacter sp.]|nr:hypothetical protein [Flavisolibacter sp.]
MKNSLNSVLRCKGNSFAPRYSLLLDTTLFLCSIIFIAIIFSSCQKEKDAATITETETLSKARVATDHNVLTDYNGLEQQTAWELQQARAATAKYRNLKNAIKDGYADINVIAENMGYHYMKASILDATIDIRQPEILVYNKDENGDFHLVAVEYAVPIELTPDTAPGGFSGTSDVWNRHTGFGLWLLHAWVWTYNPDGVFNPTNPLVHLH